MIDVTLEVSGESIDLKEKKIIISLHSLSHHISKKKKKIMKLPENK